jgi:hypothetical protein
LPFLKNLAPPQYLYDFDSMKILTVYFTLNVHFGSTSSETSNIVGNGFKNLTSTFVWVWEVGVQAGKHCILYALDAMINSVKLKAI